MDSQAAGFVLLSLTLRSVPGSAIIPYLHSRRLGAFGKKPQLPEIIQSVVNNVHLAL